MPTRDPETGDLTHNLSADIHLRDQLMPGRVEARDWPTLCRWLRSAEFKAIADRVDFITIHNHAD
jgi:hypothetical protein